MNAVSRLLTFIVGASCHVVKRSHEIAITQTSKPSLRVRPLMEINELKHIV